jgi:hypothetical protein
MLVRGRHLDLVSIKAPPEARLDLILPSDPRHAVATQVLHQKHVARAKRIVVDAGRRPG